MQTVTITHIGSQHLLTEEEYEWICANLNTAVQFAGIDLSSSGEATTLTVRKPNGKAIVLFPYSNHLKFKLSGVDKEY